jgi:hypothetical protein
VLIVLPAGAAALPTSGLPVRKPPPPPTAAAAAAAAATTTTMAAFFTSILHAAATRPFLFGLVISTAKTAAADVMVQKLVEQKEELDYRRTGIFAVFGMTYCGAWQYALFSKFMPWAFPTAASFVTKGLRAKLQDKKGLRDLGLQVVIENGFNNGMVYFPCFYSLKIMMETENFNPMELLPLGIARYRETLYEDLMAIWKVWIPVQTFNFAVLPLWARTPFTAMVSFGFTCYVSMMRGAPENSEPTSESGEAKASLPLAHTAHAASSHAAAAAAPAATTTDRHGGGATATAVATAPTGAALDGASDGGGGGGGGGVCCAAPSPANEATGAVLATAATVAGAGAGPAVIMAATSRCDCFGFVLCCVVGAGRSLWASHGLGGALPACAAYSAMAAQRWRSLSVFFCARLLCSFVGAFAPDELAKTILIQTACFRCHHVLDSSVGLHVACSLFGGLRVCVAGFGCALAGWWRFVVICLTWRGAGAWVSRATRELDLLLGWAGLVL